MWYISKYLFSTGSKAGSMFTWGRTVESLGRADQGKAVPERLEGFDNKVVRGYMGPSHSAFITNDG
jgi:hypothetical protein